MRHLKTYKILAFQLLSVALFAQVKVGDNLQTTNKSAVLEIESTSKGFLPPRLTTEQRDAITSPAEGLTVFNTTTKCINWYNGSKWINACSYDANSQSTVDGSEVVAYCAGKTISKNGCDGQTSMMWNGEVYKLTEIGGQCWFAENLKLDATKYTPSPSWVNNEDKGWNGYYKDDQVNGANGKGKLYQWSAVMNGQTEERSQGACPSGWHIPSDCEVMYLEKFIGMPETELIKNSYRGGAQLIANKLKEGGETGFNANYAGYRTAGGSFLNLDFNADIWTSSTSETDATKSYRREIAKASTGIGRVATNKADANAARCVKN